MIHKRRIQINIKFNFQMKLIKIKIHKFNKYVIKEMVLCQNKYNIQI